MRHSHPSRCHLFHLLIYYLPQFSRLSWSCCIYQHREGLQESISYVVSKILRGISSFHVVTLHSFWFTLYLDEFMRSLPMLGACSVSLDWWSGKNISQILRHLLGFWIPRMPEWDGDHAFSLFLFHSILRCLYSVFPFNFFVDGEVLASLGKAPKTSNIGYNPSVPLVDFHAYFLFEGIRVP